MSLSAHFPTVAQEPPSALRHSTSLLSASGSFPMLAALFVDEAVEAVTELAVRLTLSQSLRAEIPAVDAPVDMVSAHVNPPKPEVVVVAPATAAPAELIEYVYDGLDEYDDDSYDYEEDDYDYDDLERSALNSFKMERRPKGSAAVPIRATKDNKKEAVKLNKRYGHRLVAKMERSKSNKLDNMITHKHGRPPITFWQPDERRVRNQEEHDLAEALRRSRREGHIPAAVSVASLMDLQNRELTPEDYELLLMLDETVEKKKVSKDTFSAYPQTILKEDLPVDCPICMSPMASGDKVTTLPCSHQYHTPCIEQWLTMSSPNCPLDGLSLLHDH
jgi:hypothetical protein